MGSWAQDADITFDNAGATPDLSRLGGLEARYQDKVCDTSTATATLTCKKHL